MRTVKHQRDRVSVRIEVDEPELGIDFLSAANTAIDNVVVQRKALHIGRFGPDDAVSAGAAAEPVNLAAQTPEPITLRAEEMALLQNRASETTLENLWRILDLNRRTMVDEIEKHLGLPKVEQLPGYVHRLIGHKTGLGQAIAQIDEALRVIRGGL